jgi:hypothetical protein
MIFAELENRVLRKGKKPLQFNESANLRIGDEYPESGRAINA